MREAAMRGSSGPVRLSPAIQTALRRFCLTPDWRHTLSPVVDPRDPDVVALCEAALASIGHVCSGVNVVAHDLLLLTMAGFEVADKLTPADAPAGPTRGGKA